MKEQCREEKQRKECNENKEKAEKCPAEVKSNAGVYLYS